VRHVVRGNPVRRIEALAEQLGASCICIGSTGKGAVQRLLLGSVSQSIVRTSRIPVLTVH
jgi:nucleotide-binding universal stress UspA family protein